VGKQKENDMHGIDHEYEILLDHLNDIKFLTSNSPYYNNDEFYEDDPNEKHE
jgi:hypothetical protein